MFNCSRLFITSINHYRRHQLMSSLHGSVSVCGSHPGGIRRPDTSPIWSVAGSGHNGRHVSLYCASDPEPFGVLIGRKQNGSIGPFTPPATLFHSDRWAEHVLGYRWAMLSVAQCSTCVKLMSYMC